MTASYHAPTPAVHALRDVPDIATRIGRWASDFDPSPGRRARVRASIRDFVGCVAVGARQEELGPALLLSAPGDVRVWGLEQTLDPASAALVTGVAGSLLQLHDVYPPAGLHSSSAVISAAWASWCARRGPEASFVKAVAAGYEACHRIGLACSPGQSMAGSSTAASAGAIGAAVAAGLVSGLDAAGIGRAVSNAALLLTVTPISCMRSHGVLVPLHGGLAARAGFEASSLADRWDAGTRILEGDQRVPGLIAFLRGETSAIVPESWDGSTLDDLAWKFYPACFASQPSLEAALRLAPQIASAIHRAVIRVPARLHWLIETGAGTHLYDRLMSLRWVVARALERGCFDWTDATIDSASTRALAAKIEVVHDRALDSLPHGTFAADIELYTDEGVLRVDYRRRREHEPTAPEPCGWIQRLDEGALAAKFAALTRGSPHLGDEVLTLLR